jgi:hypothetical protein
MNRCPVRYKGKPLMPMKSTRVKKFIDSGKGRIRYDRKLRIHYLQLLVEPSSEETQDVTLGLDPGSTFDGISVVSSKCHHINIELIQRPKKGKNAIKTFKARQASTRRVRRSRLRHRPIRFDHRTSKKLAPTIKANVDFRKWVISKLIKIYPISKIVVEDVKFNHYTSTNGRAFSIVEQGKQELYRFIQALGIKLELYDGFNTKKLRVNSFGVDLKTKSKDSQTFEAHCIDSFVLACNKSNVFDIHTGEIFIDEPIITNDVEINRKVTFIEKIVKIRRCLTRTRALYKSGKRLEGANYYIKLKGGVKQIVIKLGRRNVCRIKPEGEHSNHPRKWEYIDNGRAERYKCNTAPYGGTRINGKSFLRNGEWENRRINIS